MVFRYKVSRDLRAKENVRKSRDRKRKNVNNPKTAESEEISFSSSAKKLKANRILNFITVFGAISR